MQYEDVIKHKSKKYLFSKHIELGVLINSIVDELL